MPQNRLERRIKQLPLINCNEIRAQDRGRATHMPLATGHWPGQDTRNVRANGVQFRIGAHDAGDYFAARSVQFHQAQSYLIQREKERELCAIEIISSKMCYVSFTTYKRLICNHSIDLVGRTGSEIGGTCETNANANKHATRVECLRCERFRCEPHSMIRSAS